MNQHPQPIKHISSYFRGSIGVMVTIAMAQPTFAVDFYLRGPQVSAIEYQSFVIENHFQTFSDWQLEQISKYSSQLKDLDNALEKSIADPIGALVDFDQAIAELQSQPLNEESRDLLKYILMKIDSLKIPESHKLLYQKRLASLSEIVKMSSQIPAPQKQKDRELVLITDKILNRFNLEDAVILVEGLPVKNFNVSITLGKMVHQWTIISNSFSNLIFVGEWSEFLNFVNTTTIFSRPLIVGNCDSSSLNPEAFKSMPILISARNARAYMGKNCNPQIQTQPQLELNSHLGSVEAQETNGKHESNKLLWLASGLLAIGIVYLYTNRDKQLAIEFPF